jgi:putative lipoic acid-binding regulatory protein
MDDSPSLEQFPCFYTFKIFGRRGETFVDRVCEILGKTLGPVPRDSVKVRKSSRGAYQSVTVYIRVENRAQLGCVYRDLQAQQEVLFCI